MLRVTIHDGPSEFRLRLEGRLAGPWVREVQLCWQTAQSIIHNRTATIDLRDVDFVDSAGEQLLTAMYEHGAQLVATGPMTGNMVSKITAGAKKWAEAETLSRRNVRSS
jgi:ABC-type transporter Mla MlaB component